MTVRGFTQNIPVKYTPIMMIPRGKHRSIYGDPNYKNCKQLPKDSKELAINNKRKLSQ